MTRAEFWRYCRPRAASAAAQIALERSDVILVSALAGPAAAGVYGTLTRFVTVGNFVVFVLGQATSPQLRRALARGDRAGAQRLLDQATAWMVLTAGPYLLLVATVAGPLLAVLDADLRVGATALSVAAVGMVGNALAGPADLTLLMLGRSRASLAVTAGALAVDVAVAIVAIGPLGLVGAALAWAAAVVVQNGAALWLVWRHGGLRPGGGPTRVAAAGAMLAVAPVAGLRLTTGRPDDLAGLVAAAAVAGLVLAGWTAVHARRLGLRGGRPPAAG